jgi:hypothetical protein
MGRSIAGRSCSLPFASPKQLSENRDVGACAFSAFTMQVVEYSSPAALAGNFKTSNFTIHHENHTL